MHQCPVTIWSVAGSIRLEDDQILFIRQNILNPDPTMLLVNVVLNTNNLENYFSFLFSKFIDLLFNCIVLFMIQFKISEAPHCV